MSSYLKFLSRNKLYTVIEAVGLAVSLAFVIIMTQQAHSPVPNLEIKFLNWMGDISYEIYVVQIIVIILLSLLYSKAGIELPAAVIYLVCSAIVIGVAWCFHKTLGRLFKVKHK